MGRPKPRPPLPDELFRLRLDPSCLPEPWPDASPRKDNDDDDPCGPPVPIKTKSAESLADPS
eukprot:CAMPEP_0195257332 /NCGR_PEP_ID=MMETSP0706-20130129/6756_1 /TAXON_ID=33640 /ORGANISM="Asterionellopsis glacialis, Strain CCMP134" /LENGTH=61 /DNA_ID=CAMNT_0040310521 /DNA_START=490 /DNA_END=672 /DNA_ORIENTATION=+